MAKKLVKQVIAFADTDGSLYETFAEAAVSSAANVVRALGSFEIDVGDDGDEASPAARAEAAREDLFAVGAQYSVAYSIAVFMQHYKAEFRAILRDL